MLESSALPFAPPQVEPASQPKSNRSTDTWYGPPWICEAPRPVPYPTPYPIVSSPTATWAANSIKTCVGVPGECHLNSQLAFPCASYDRSLKVAESITALL